MSDYTCANCGKAIHGLMYILDTDAAIALRYARGMMPAGSYYVHGDGRCGTDYTSRVSKFGVHIGDPVRVATIMAGVTEATGR